MTEVKKSWNVVSNLEEIIEILTSEEFDNLGHHLFNSNIPGKCLVEPCILGIDEAGRGPVLGPMVYSVFFCSINDVDILKDIGCTDSKILTEKKREDIFELINQSNDKLGWAVDLLSPNLISNKMLQRKKYSLNEIAQNSTINLIESILEKKIVLNDIFVDTIGPADKYQMSFSNLKFLTAADVKSTKKLSTGNVNLDKILCGGIIAKGITEICGESGCGKTQLCLQLSLSVQFPENVGGLNGNAIYICTEEKFQSKRLNQIIKNFAHKIDKSSNINFTDNIFVTYVADHLQFKNLFCKIIYLLQNKNIKLIIVDSLTSLFRGNILDCEGLQKVNELRSIAKFFYKLCKDYNILVICVNQVSQSPEINEPVPALGLAWGNLINTRIQLKKKLTSRSLEVIFSPSIPHGEIEFFINEFGEKLSKLFPNSKVTVKSKADLLYPIVGAASICAKVIRDTAVQQWKFPEKITIDTEFGTGYPGDPKTKKFLFESKDSVFGFPNLVRFSWSTSAKLLEEETSVEWENEEINKANSMTKQSKISRFFTCVPKKDKHVTTCSFFKKRNLQSLINFNENF